MFQSQGPLYGLSVNNIQVTCNAWAYREADRYGKELVFASLIGPASLLKGVRGTLDSNKRSTVSLYPIRLNEAPETLAGHGSVHYIGTGILRRCHRAMTTLKDLQPVQSNLIVWTRQPEDEETRRHPRYALARTQEDLPAMYLQHLLRNTDVMALPHWARAVYDFAVANELVQPLTCHNLAGCVVATDGAEPVREFISENLRQERLPIAKPAPAG